METIKKSFFSRFKSIINRISEDNLTLLSSSISYYSALALAPFALILLGVASLIGSGMQQDIVRQASITFSPEVGQMIRLIFQNVNEGVNLGSLSGIIGALILFSTASLVFLQFRYSFDVIYGCYDPNAQRSTWAAVKEKLFAMLMVLATAVMFILSLFITTIFGQIFGGAGFWSRGLILLLNFMIYLAMFTGIHYFAPTKRPAFYNALKISILSSIFFMIGNVLLAFYLKKIAAGSVYGAAGSFLVFLIWAYYSSFTVFLSVELFLYLKRTGKVKS